MTEPRVINRAWHDKQHEIVKSICEYEEMFGKVPHYLCTENSDPELYNAVGLIAIPREVVDAMFGLPRLEQRFIESDGATHRAFVVMENITNYVLED